MPHVNSRELCKRLSAFLSQQPSHRSGLSLEVGPAIFDTWVSLATPRSGEHHHMSVKCIKGTHLWIRRMSGRGTQKIWQGCIWKSFVIRGEESGFVWQLQAVWQPNPRALVQSREPAGFSESFQNPCHPSWARCLWQVSSKSGLSFVPSQWPPSLSSSGKEQKRLDCFLLHGDWTCEYLLWALWKEHSPKLFLNTHTPHFLFVFGLSMIFSLFWLMRI